MKYELWKYIILPVCAITVAMYFFSVLQRYSTLGVYQEGNSLRKESNIFCTIKFESNEDEQLLTFFEKINSQIIKSNQNKSLREEILIEFIKTDQHHRSNLSAVLVSMSKSKMLLPFYKWKINKIRCQGGNEVIIFIHETFRNSPTSGGSSFTILQTSDHTKDFCPVIDLFSGTYVAKCLLHESNTTLTGIVQFLNFTAFSRTTKAFNKSILSFKETDHYHDISDSRKHWVLEGNNWKWWTYEGHVQRTNKTKLQHCFESYSMVTFIGDSHIRNLCYYVGLHLSSFKSIYHTKKIRFLWGGYIHEAIKSFKLQSKLFKKSKGKDKFVTEKKKKKLFILNSLQWDTAKGNISTYISGFRHLVKLLKNTTQADKSVRVIYLSAAAFPNRYQNNLSFNGYLLRALNSISMKTMKENGIETFDVHNMLYSVNNYSCDYTHYLTVNKTSLKYSGVFGSNAADSVVQFICQNKNELYSSDVINSN